MLAGGRQGVVGCCIAQVKQFIGNFLVNKSVELATSNAKRAVEFACDFRQQLLEEEQVNKLHRSWFALLEQYSIAVAAMRHATRKGKHKNWSDRLLSEQKSDPRLNYAFQSWNTQKHNHEREDKTEDKSVNIMDAIQIKGTVKNLQVSNLIVQRGDQVRKLGLLQADVDQGKVVKGAFPPGSIKEVPDHIVLSKIINRSVTFEVPNKDLPEEDRANDIADRICDWLIEKIDELEALAQ